jgi:hypothetical protein
MRSSGPMMGRSDVDGSRDAEFTVKSSIPR